jgi:hypothetical protein
MLGIGHTGIAKLQEGTLGLLALPEYSADVRVNEI